MEPSERTSPPSAFSSSSREWSSYVAELQRAGSALRPPFERQLAAFHEAYAERGALLPPPAAWFPNEKTTRRSNLFRFMEELELPDYESLHRFSVGHRDRFWRSVLERLGIVFETPPARILDSNDPKRPNWLDGARYEITRSCFQADAQKAAIVYGRASDGRLERLSYEELENEVDRFANALRGRGFDRGDGVALYMPMSPQCIVAYLGAIRAGCRVVSIADSFAVQELRKRIEIGSARAVVTVAGYERAGKTINLYAKVRSALEPSESDAFVIVTEPTGALDPRDLAWSDFLGDESPEPILEQDRSPAHVTNVLFSSGTTGTPKAIPWTQLTPIKAAMDAYFHQDVHHEDIVCWPTNIGWMMGPWLIYAALINRATMALYEGIPTSEGFHRFVEDAGVSVLGVVPSIVKAWRANDTVRPGGWSRSRLRVLSSTGEASSFEDYLWLMSLADYRAPVIEYLGGTEIGGGHLTSTLLHEASPSTFRTPALGIDVVILDEDGPVDDGGSGEMFLVPPALGLSERLVNKSDDEHDHIYYDDCPLGPSGELLRRHGDQVAKLPGGYYKAEGRVDDTMNLGGIKVSSLEIERVVNEHAAVHESAAIAVTRGGGAASLVVFVVLASGTTRTDEELRKDLKSLVATYLNPLYKLDDLVVVDQLPRTASNKVMRRKLRSDYESQTRER